MTEDEPEGFDKEAERRKLEEKYGENEDDDTRRMSELLLKGATMTNRHCNTCGDPLFRQNGEEFCPTCNAAGANGDTPQSAAGDAQATGGQATTDEQTPAPDESAGTTATESAQPSQSAEPRGSADRPRPNTDGRVRDDAAGRTTTDSPDSAPISTGVSDGRAAPDREPTDVGDLDEARRVLIAAVTRHARAGAEATDPRRAKDQFAAAREAAEALAALRR